MNKGDIAALKASGIIYRIIDERHDGRQYIETITSMELMPWYRLPIEIDHAELIKLSRSLTPKERKQFPAETHFWQGP